MDMGQGHLGRIEHGENAEADCGVGRSALVKILLHFDIVPRLTFGTDSTHSAREELWVEILLSLSFLTPPYHPHSSFPFPPPTSSHKANHHFPQSDLANHANGLDRWAQSIAFERGHICKLTDTRARRIGPNRNCNSVSQSHVLSPAPYLELAQLSPEWV